MSHKKQTQTVTYAEVPRHDTPDIVAARSGIQNINLTAPINQAYGAAEDAASHQQFDEPLSPDTQDRIRLSNLFNLSTRKAQDLTAATAQQEALKSGQMLSLAGMTQNPILQTGGTTTQSGGFWMGLLDSAASGAAAGAAG